jgi:hypothetical protein
MMAASRTLCRALVLVALLLASSARADDATPDPDAERTPDATLTLRGRAAAAGVGFVWGASTLEFRGKTYPVRADGFVAGAVGVGSVEGTGKVYGLKDAKDLEGDYTAVGAGTALGRGSSRVVMRNDKGVRIVVDTRISGLQLGIGPRGIALRVGEAGGPPADDRAHLPDTLGFGEARFGRLFLRPTFNGQIFFSASRNPGFDGEFAVGPVDEADDWLENSAETGLNARLSLGQEGRYGTLQARVSGVYSGTSSGPDGPACNGSSKRTDDLTLESAYVSWKSGKTFADLGTDAVEISAGNQNYQIWDGLLFWDGGQDCQGRGANWISPRKAFQDTAVVKLHMDELLLEGAHLEFNDEDPDSDTKLGLGRVEYATDEGFMEHLKLGLMYFRIYDSDTESRDGMKGIYLYHEAAPLRSVPDLTYKASFVRESNSRSSGLSRAYGWYFNPSYQFSDTRWTPQIGYRYATFSGGGTEAFDPLFAGLPDWGTWVQGELLGEYIISNSNLISHQVRLTAKPSDKLTFNVIYYKFLLDDREQSFGTTTSKVSSRLADEVDLIFDVALTNWWSITATVSMAIPNSGFREATGGTATSFNGYLYMNFNF